MHFLSEELRGIYLHESNIKEILCEASRLEVRFGLCSFDSEDTQGKNLVMVININNITPQNIDSYVRIVRPQKLIKNNLSFSGFKKLLRKNEFIIESEYYSEFERALLLIGYLNDAPVHFKITDIDKLSFMYD